MRGAGRLPALDGLRGVAVAAVLLYHGGVGWARGGFLGVDVFFVLSGFLITALLVEERRRSHRIDLAAFWGRRVRRLAPALLAVLAVTTLYAVAFAPPETRAGLHGDVLAALAYVGNWHFAVHRSGYFDLGTQSPLLHTWSLGIEEQFYLLWPVLASAALARRNGQARLLLVAAGGAGFSALLMAHRFVPYGDLSKLYMGTDTRAQSLLVGAALGALLAGLPTEARPKPGARVVLAGLGWAGALTLTWAMVRVEDESAWLYRGGFLVVALATAAVLLSVLLLPRARLGRALSAGPLADLGRISYGLYLWHWPVFLVLTRQRTGLGGPALLLLRLVVSVTVAAVSYAVIEEPALRRPARSLRLPSLAGATAALIALTVLVTTPPSAVLPGQAVAAVSEPVASVPSPSLSPAGPAASPAASPVTSPSPSASPWSADRSLRVLVVGDSVAKTLAATLPRPEGVRLYNGGELGCGVIRRGIYRYFGSVHRTPDQCATWAERWQAATVRHDPDVVLVVIGRWEVMDRQVDGTWTHVGEPAYDELLRSELERMVPALARQGTRIALGTAPYYRRGERPDGGTWPEDEPERVDRLNVILREFAARHAGVVTLVEFGSRLGPDGGYTSTVDGVKVRSDGVHLTRAGGRWVGPWLYPQLAAAARPAADSH